MCCPVELQTIIAVCLILTIIRPDRPALSRNSNVSLRNTIFFKFAAAMCVQGRVKYNSNNNTTVEQHPERNKWKLNFNKYQYICDA